MTALPNDPITKIGPPAGVNRDLPAAEFPSVVRIQPTDLVGPDAANRQPSSLEKRTESLRVAVNKIIDIVNLLDTTFLRRDNTPAKDAVVGPTDDLSMNGRRLMQVGAPQNDDDVARLAEINYVLSLIGTLSGTPSGMLAGFAGLIPAGWLVCDGAQYTPTAIIRPGGATEAYPETFDWGALISLRLYLAQAGNPWGGDGISSIVVPDYRGRVIIGAGSAAGRSVRILGAAGGAESHLLSLPEMPQHAHNYEDRWSTSGTGVGVGGDDEYNLRITTRTTALAGGSTPHNNMQPFAVATVGIKI